MEGHQRVTASLAETVRRLRTGRTWTLDELARRSGVSRRLIIQIEQSDANPSLGTLLRLADALEVTLTDLLRARESAALGLRPASEAVELWSGPAGGSGRLLVSHGPIELWSWTLAPGDNRESEAHRPGSLELVSVTKGTLQLDVGDTGLRVVAGDSAWFDASHPHAYRNPTRSTIAFTLVVLEAALGLGVESGQA